MDTNELTEKKVRHYQEQLKPNTIMIDNTTGIRYKLKCIDKYGLTLMYINRENLCHQHVTISFDMFEKNIDNWYYDMELTYRIHPEMRGQMTIEEFRKYCDATAKDFKSINSCFLKDELGEFLASVKM